ncbi:PREDICTED: uncharacterized protein LOC105564640 isoform X2 [Vollenhovia emeryi]|uniref:uncharacterized protein LOC105564640 isoform X2 n=1 Tax=Vollenhovia emeryi TaxID=411798 RepID=UPI0005F3C2B9|nr:PREDICTED: uncharacterized protein LOC105564640 isoform X2 [Vollenhovia emeryi]
MQTLYVFLLLAFVGSVFGKAIHKDSNELLNSPNYQQVEQLEPPKGLYIPGSIIINIIFNNPDSQESEEYEQFTPIVSPRPETQDLGLLDLVGTIWDLFG